MREKGARAQKAYQSIVKAGEFLGKLSGNGVEGPSHNNNADQRGFYWVKLNSDKKDKVG